VNSPVAGGTGTAAAVRHGDGGSHAVRAGHDRRRLTRRIVLGAILVALMIVGLTAATMWRLRQDQLDDGLSDLLAFDLLVAAQSERTFENVAIVLDDVAADLQARGIASGEALRQATGDEATYRLLRAKMASAPQLEGLSLVAANGDLITDTRGYPIAPAVNLADRDYFLGLRDHPERAHYITAPLPGSRDGDTTIYIGKRLSAPNGAFTGEALGAVSLRHLEDLYASYLQAVAGDGKSITLWRADGTLLARVPATAQPGPDAAPESTNADENAFRTTAKLPLAAFWASDVQGPVAVVQRRLDQFPLIIETRQSASDIVARWSDEGIAAMLAGAALLALLGLAVWLLLRQLQAAAVVSEERARADRETEAREEVERAMAKAETAMRDAQHSEARFRDIVEVGSDWIWETDAQHRFTLVAGAKRPKVSLIGKARWEQEGADPEKDEVWGAHKADLDAHRPFRHFRFTIKLHDEQFHVCVNGKPVFDDDGSFVGYRGTVTDETELVEARERALRADALLRNAIESIAEGFVIFDADDRFVMCNEAYRKMYGENAAGFIPGASYEQIMRQALATGRHPGALGREEEWLAERMLKHRGAVESEESRLADGRWVMRSERRMPDGGIAGLRIDITALKKAQESLNESQMMLNRAQRLSGTGSVVRNLRTQALEWSDEMYRIFGLDRGSFTPSTGEFRERIHPEDRDAVSSAREAGLSGQSVAPLEFRVLRSDGTVRWVYREVELVRDSAGEATSVLATYQDITERRAAAARQRELEALLGDAIDSISEGFVIFDAEDRLVLCNEAYRRLYSESAEMMVRGTRYEEIVRAAAANGRYPDARGREEEWIAERLQRHTSLQGPIEQRLDDGRWLLFSERRMSNGGTAGLRVDITALKAAQESLRESQVMLNRAQQLSGTGSVVRNLTTKATEWSDEMYRIMGVTRDTFVPHSESFLSLIHPDDRANVAATVATSLQAVSEPPIEFRIIRPDGSTRWVYRETDFWGDHGGETLVRLSTYKDITEQREAEARQRALEVLLRDAIESISEGFVIYDADDRIVLCNDAYRALYPYSADMMIPGARFEDILRSSARFNRNVNARGREEEWLAERIHQHHNPHEPFESQLEDGRWLLISERRTSSGGTAGLRVDITALKRVQQSLHESQQRLDRTQQIAHIGTVERDLRTKEVVWSDETYRIFGVNRDSYIPSAENLLALVHPEDRARMTAALYRSDEAHAGSTVKYRVVRPNGEVRTIFSQANTAIDERGQPLYISVAMMDITEKELADDRQIELETQLRHSEKLTALGTLAGGIAHDLNNTLVPIQALSKLALAALPTDAPLHDDLDSIHQASIQARDLVRQILAFSRKEVVVEEPTDVAARLREVLHILHASVPSTIELVERIAAVPPILADASQLQQVVINLVTNAAHAIDDKVGRITVSLDEVPGEAGKQGWLRLSIADTGCGMSSEIMHRMFEPFFTTKGVGEGTGLGLSVVHGIVTSRGGTIDVKSVPGEGTEFIILLPAKPVSDAFDVAAVA
jgi:PAS domain S-box-containing protein